MKELTIFTVNSLGKDIGNGFDARFPEAWKGYQEAIKILGPPAKGSLICGATIYPEESSGFICCTHFIPGSHSSVYEYLTAPELKDAPSNAYPKFREADNLEGMEIYRYTDYEAYIRGMSRIKELAGREGYDKIKLIWSVDGSQEVIGVLTKEVFKDSQIEVEICLEDQYWQEYLSA
jgi:hypothetical protein